MLYTQRIFWQQIETPSRAERTLDFLSEHRRICDEVSIFTEGDGCDLRFLTAAEVERRAAILTPLVAHLRQLGIRPVINVLNTLGHSDSGGAGAPEPTWSRMVGTDGTTARWVSCPADKQFLAYTRAKYETFGRCGADRYWIDDDVRLGNHSPVQWGCFCDACLASFSRRTGRTWERRELVAAFVADLGVRRAWLSRNREVFLAILDNCAAGIAAGAPTAEIGFMTIDLGTYLDVLADPREWFAVLSVHTDAPMWLRPGGGFWNDDVPRGVLDKAFSVGRQIAATPNDVRTSVEVENYPYALGSKSAFMVGLECLVGIAATRLDGIMFNMLDGAGNPLEPYGRFAAELGAWSPLWDGAAELVADTLPVGWLAPTVPLLLAQAEVAPGSDIGALPLRQRFPGSEAALPLQLAGLPLTTFPAGALGHLLNGATAANMTSAQLQALATKPLILDADAAERFLAFGLGDRIGLASLTWHTDAVHEVIDVHALQPEIVGYRRAVTLAYFGERSAAMQPLPGAETLSRLVTTLGDTLGAALTMYVNADGATVIILGHLPWRHHLSPQRMMQLRTLSQWVLGDAVPITLDADRAVVLWTRRSTSGDRWLAVVFNAGFDPAPDVRLCWNGDAAQTPTLALGTPGVSLMEELPEVSLHLPAWSVAIVEWK